MTTSLEQAVEGTQPRRHRDLIGRLLPWILLAAAVGLSFRFGKYPVSLADLWALGSDRLNGRQGGMDPVAAQVIWNIRLPRVLASVLVGAALSGAGAAFQGLFRNPLVSPDILGVSAGAGAGAVFAILLGLPVYAIEGAAFAGGLAAVAAAWAISTCLRRRDPALVLVLAGICLDKLLLAVTSLMKLYADPYSQLPTITYWLMGGLNGTGWADVLAAMPPVLMGLLVLVLLRWQMNVISLGEEEARSLGVDTGRLRGLMVLAATLMTAASVALAGPVGWVGLVVPHIARMLVGPDFRRLLPTSLLLGAGFVTVMDCLARVAGIIELPLGLYTAVVGAPFFLWLLASARRGW
ncbi:MAG: iron ABC transporter permease [Telmatospirillum sp.]|nr:iron ABC transporter permease [Telmatospirillum sp.]